MVKVYIWDFQGKNVAWGHASMDVNGKYISWWPASPGAVPSKIHPNIYASLPIANRTLQDDINGENGQPPNHTIVLEGLNEDAIIQWWRGTALSYGGFPEQGPPSVPYHTLKWNCSTIVATALKEGGGDEYAFITKTYNFVWTPNNVKDYALSIAAGLKSGR